MDDDDPFEMALDDELTEFNIEESEFLPVSKIAAASKKP